MRIRFMPVAVGLGFAFVSGVLAANAQDFEAPPVEAVVLEEPAPATEPDVAPVQAEAPEAGVTSGDPSIPEQDALPETGPEAGLEPGPEKVDAIVENELCHAQFFGDGTPEQAIIHCTRALEAGDLPEGDMVTAHVNRGVAYKLTGQLDAAIEDYTKALELSPESGDIYTTRANAFLEMAQLDAAINDANKALAFNPNYAAAYFVRGRIFEALGQKGFARDDFVRAYELAPDNKDIEEKAWAYGSNQN